MAGAAASERDDGAAADPLADLDVALRRARNGDETGFRVLWCALQPRLLRYLRLQARELAEDVAAETWLQVVRDLQRFRGDATDFRAWLFTVARHRAVDAARARQARPVMVTNDPHACADVPPAPSAETQALEHAATERALALVATLPKDQAEMVALRVIAGLDVASVAEIVGKSPGAVRVSVHRALRVLSTRLEPPVRGSALPAEVTP